MSQKENDFQSKPKRGGQKFGGGGGERRPAGRGFSDKYKGDSSERPRRSTSGDRPFVRRERSEGGDDKPRGRTFEKRSFGGNDSRPPRDRNGSDRPYKKREFDPSKPRREYNPEARRDFGDKKPYNKESSSGERKPFREKRDFGDKKPYSKERDAGDRKPFREKRDFGDKKPYTKERRPDRPQKSYERYGDRPVRREFRDQRPRQDFTTDSYTPASAETQHKLKSSRPAYGAPSAAYLYGTHAVTQALLNSARANKRLLCTQKAFESISETWSEAQEDGVTLPEVITVEKEDLERLLPRDAVHQDLLLDCAPLEEMPLHELLLTIEEDAKVLVLDQVTDPHNVGAILRSAAAFGAKAVIMQTLHAPDITGVLAKSASGAVEHVPIIREVNLSRALEQLKKAGFFCIGLAEEGKQTLAQLKLTGKTALVLGAEGAGLRRLVAENCDELVKLPTQDPIGSLNVSNAAAVALYELCRK